MKPNKRLGDNNSPTVGVITATFQNFIQPKMFTMSFLLTLYFQIQN